MAVPDSCVDAESGFNYNYFRDYDPGTGRYVESDPIGLGGGVSTYAYVGGNPLSLTDLRGLWVKKCRRWLKGLGVKGATNRFNPLVHMYLDISGTTIGFAPDGSLTGMIISQGQYETAENPANDNCETVCDDPAFDGYVKAAIAEVGLPFYSLFGDLKLNTMECQQWVRRVLYIAKTNYLASQKCPKCFK